MTAPTRAQVFEARGAVVRARTEFRRGTISYDQLAVIVDRYADLVVARAKALGLPTRRPSKNYLLRAL
jgi:hypothetical protein